ncbi:DUF4956 domain-containing protein [Nocardioides jensenii]|uniref:DUF4956 domain-containing protein n=1 Tax=Nocardioides jensenii TaxID=1843 RepID=UPI0009EB03CA|nr:DUF4956 domain-containing protein [Nocardioides jensenii]
MKTVLIVAFDIVAIAVLAHAIYFRRHRRRDMLIAYTALNVGVMAVAMVLATSTVAAGLGLGLFGVLSIIRLRSSALTQEEVGYYFASLALGLICGLRPDPVWIAPLVGALLVAVMYVADHPRMHVHNRQQELTLDRAITDERILKARLGDLLGADIQRFIVTETDLVRDVTVVDVRYRVHPQRRPLDAGPDDQPEHDRLEPESAPYPVAALRDQRPVVR